MNRLATPAHQLACRALGKKLDKLARQLDALPDVPATAERRAALWAEVKRVHDESDKLVKQRRRK